MGFLLVLLCTAAVCVHAVVVPGHAAPTQGPQATQRTIERPRLDDLMKRLGQLKAGTQAPSQPLEHPEVRKPTDADKHVAPENRLAYLMDTVKAFQAQHLVLGAAVHAVKLRFGQEAASFKNEQAVLADSVNALFENIASRLDLEEVAQAANEDNNLHVELEEAVRKLEEMMSHVQDIKGGEEDGGSVEAEWKRLMSVVDSSSVEKELDHVKSVVEALRRYHGNTDSSLYYFVVLNLSFVLAVLLWWSRASSRGY